MCRATVWTAIALSGPIFGIWPGFMSSLLAFPLTTKTPRLTPEISRVHPNPSSALTGGPTPDWVKREGTTIVSIERSAAMTSVV
jgi:hypothetical protein